MWILVLILSIKLEMTTWYWILFTVITIFRPFIWIFKYNFAEGFMRARNKSNKN